MFPVFFIERAPFVKPLPTADISFYMRPDVTIKRDQTDTIAFTIIKVPLRVHM